MDIATFSDGDRVTHADRGLGTICVSPEDRGLIVLKGKATDASPGRVYVIWDDERFPVESVAEASVELLPIGALAMSSGV